MSSSLALIDNALSLEKIIQQRDLVMKIMKSAMVEGTHYGKIPGCGEKPSLLLPGAQLLSTTFRLVPSFTKTVTEPQTGHISVDFVCILTHDEKKIAEGIGFCSSLESKYRYRNSAAVIEDTGEEVPKAYWDDFNKDKTLALKNLSQMFDGQKVSTKKIDGIWRVVILKGGGDGKVENSNPIDTFNTVLKIGKKRAHIDAVITATACNDLFTQDLEDIRDNLNAIDGEFTDHKPEKRESHAETRTDSRQDKPTPAHYDKHKTKTKNETQVTHKGVTISGISDFKFGKKNTPAWNVEFSRGGEVVVRAATFSTTCGPQCVAAFEGNPEFKYDITVNPGTQEGNWLLMEITEEDNIPDLGGEAK